MAKDIFMDSAEKEKRKKKRTGISATRSMSLVDWFLMRSFAGRLPPEVSV